MILFQKIRRKIIDLKLIIEILEDKTKEESDFENRSKLRYLINDLKNAKDILKESEIKSRNLESWIGEIDIKRKDSTQGEA